jgi:hypothetical protein
MSDPPSWQLPAGRDFAAVLNFVFTRVVNHCVTV